MLLLLTLALFQLPDFDLASLGKAATVGAFIVAALWGARKKLRTIKQDAADAATKREQDIQKRIEDAVELERQRCRESKVDETERIQRLRELANEAERLAETRRQRADQLEAEVVGIRTQLDHLQEKYDDVVELNVGLQASVKDLNERVAAFERNHVGCGK